MSGRLTVAAIGFGLLTALFRCAPTLLAAPMPFSTNEAPPPVVVDTTKPRQCTIAYLVVDSATNDVLVPRMIVEPNPDEKGVGGLLPCPAMVPPRLAARALDTCLSRAADPKTCVFGDMSRGFEERPDARNSAENTSRCASDVDSYIGIACWRMGDLDVCNVACGKAAQEAKDLARGRCEVKHQKRCDITGAVSVLPAQ
jgi:hypothetical protein